VIAIATALVGLRKIKRVGQWLENFRQRRQRRRSSQQLGEQTGGDIELEIPRTNEQR
jgi:hypothetical protein